MATLSETSLAPGDANLTAVLAQDALDREQVEADLTYMVDTGVKPVTYMPPPEGGELRRTASYAPYRVSIRNARPVAGAFLDRKNGNSISRWLVAAWSFFCMA